MQKPIKGYIPKKPIQPQPSLGGSIDSIVKVKDELEVLKNDLTSAVDTKIAEMDSSLSSFSEEAKSATQKIDDKVAEFEQTAITLITDIHNIPQLQGTPGKDAAPVDEDKIVKNILSQIPQPQTIDENLIVKKVLQAIPKNKADLKIIQETFETDPMSVIEKIMAMPEGKFKLKTSHIDGLEQTMSAFRSQLGRGYLHGGGLSTVSHDSTLTGDGTPTNPLHVVASATTEITGLIQPGTNITFTGTGTTLDPYIVNSTGGGGTPGGLNAQLQYNNAGVFGGISGATTDGTAVSLNAAHLLNPTINGAGTGLATLVYPNTSSSVTITVPATTGTLALTSQLTNGTVTSVATDSTLTGGPITTSGTLGINLANANIWTAKQTIQLATAQLGLNFDGTHTTTFTTDSTGTLNIANTANTTSITGTVNAGIFSYSGSIRAQLGTPENGNFFGVGGAAVSGTDTTASILFAGASNVQYRNTMSGTTSTALTANNSYGTLIMGSAAVTIPGTGTNAFLANLVIKPLIITTGSGTATNSASLYIDGAATGATNNYALYVAAGNVNIQSLSTGLVKSTSGLLSSATAGTDYQAPITLTTTGTSGVATFISNTLNIPNYIYTLPTASTSVLGGVKVDGTSITISGGVISATSSGGGTVTTVSVATANGFSGTVANATTTPAITIIAGAITPTSVNGVVLSGSSTPTLAVTGTTTVSGANTGDQTITLTGAVTGSGTGSFATTIQSSIALPGNPTTTTQTPADNSTKIATTAYVDAAVLGQNFKEAVGAATTANLVGVYLNGASGVGATFTYTATGVDTIDGVTLTLGMRVLLKNQTSSFQNGIYTVTTAGALGIAGVLTRATDANQSSEWKTGDSVFVTAGTTLSTTTWAYTGIDSPTMGTTAITFAQTAGQGSFTAGNGIAITGNSIAIDTSITVDKTTAQVLTNKDLTSGTNTFPTFNQNTTGSAATLTTPRAINGVNFDGSAAITVTAAAGTLTGTTLNSTVVTSSLTSVGTITTGVWNGTAIANANLANSAVTIGSTSVSLGATVTTFAGLVSVTSTSFVGALTGNASTVTTNANLTGVITSSGNATSIASQTGTGTKFVVDTSPTLVTPNIGVATATSINKVTITAPATSSTLTVADGSSLITSGAFALTLTSSATSNATIPAGTNTLYSTLSGSITSAQLATSLTDETGSGVVVFGTTPSLTTSVLLSSGFVMNWASSNVVLTHSSAVLTLGTGELRITSPGTTTTSVPTLSSTNTLTNKRITKRTGTVASSGTPTINSDTTDFFSITALAVAITSFTTNLSGTPTEAQTLWIAITDNGTARAIAWGTSFEASTVALPTTTVISTRLDVGFVWNTVTSKWRCVAVA